MTSNAKDEMSTLLLLGFLGVVTTSYVEEFLVNCRNTKAWQ